MVSNFDTLPRYFQRSSISCEVLFRTENLHWKAALGILAYINGISVLFCHCISERDISRYSISLEVFADADYASAATYRRSSVSGGPVMCGGECVCWLSRTQKCVTRSASEAEYVALEDNQGAMQLSKNPVVEVKFEAHWRSASFSERAYSLGAISMNRVPPEHQHAGILTKALAFHVFVIHRRHLMKNLKD